MKKLNTLTLLLSVVLLHACTPKTEWDKAKWHKYAIEAYYVPNYVYVAKAEGQKTLLNSIGIFGSVVLKNPLSRRRQIKNCLKR
mgnify:CR=1 FL=1